MKNRSWLTSIGILIYVISSIIDRFFYKISDYIYIPLIVIGIVLCIIGFIKDKKQ